MDSRPTNNKIAQFPSPQRSQSRSGYGAILTEINNAPKRPLRLVIACPALVCLKSKDITLAELISTELQLWSEALGARELSALFLLHPYTVLAPYELTGILHAVTSRFHVPEFDNINFSVVSDAIPINANNLALTKGLGFTNIQLIVDDPQLADETSTAKTVALLREYRIESVGIQINVADCLGDQRNAIRRIDEKCQPDYICIGQQLTSLDIVTDNGCRYSQALQQDNDDTITLGPNTCSNINGRQLTSYSSELHYLNALAQARLPIHVHTQTE